MNIDEILNKANFLQESVETNFRLKLKSKQQDYDNSFITLVYTCMCSELKIVIPNGESIWLVLTFLTEEPPDVEIHRYIEKIVPLNEVIPNIEFLLAIDNICIKAEKGICKMPKNQEMLLLEFRKRPYKGEENE